MTKFKRVLGNLEEEEHEFEQRLIVLPSQNDPNEFKPHIVKLYGEINEESCAELIDNLYEMKEISRDFVHEDPEDPESEVKEIYKPFDLLISTEGGLVSDMFSVYDVMRQIRKDCGIATFGVGQVASAGVLLLAAGTKGQRKIGKNCSVMIHEISGGHFGSIKEIKNDTKQVQRIRNQYIDALVQETKLTRKKILYFFRKHVDIYFTAEEALKHGIVDIIV